MPIFSQPQTKRTILDVLIEQGLISHQDAEVIGSKYYDNLSIEKAIKEKNILDEATLAKAYAVYYNLPFVILSGRSISQDVLTIIPREVAQKYQIIAYELTFPVLKVALANPVRLPSDARNVLEDLGNKKKIRIDLAITTPQDILLALKNYQGAPRPPVHPAPLPPRPIVPPHPPTQVQPTSSPSTIQRVTLTDKKIPASVLEKFPKEVAQKYKMVVFEAPAPDKIKVAIVNPENPRVKEIITFIQEKNNLQIEQYQTSENDINFALRGYPRPVESAGPPEAAKPTEAPFGQIPEVKQEEIKEEALKEKEPSILREEFFKKEEKGETSKVDLEAMEEPDLDDFLKEKIVDVEDIKSLVRTGSVPRILAAIIVLAAKKGSSDIHIEPLAGFLRLRYRLDGILEDILKIPITLHPAIVSRIKILAKLKLDEQRVPQDGRFNVICSGHEIDLRISTLPTVHGEKVVMRILDKSVGILTLEQLGLTDYGFKAVLEAIKKPYGIVLSTGPTGSGKSTTLYAILNRLSTPGVNIITLEDPVEYEIPGINQCQVKPQIGFSFADGLRSVLRQDPNIIMVGEIRDRETAELTTHAALTGHVVLSTLHTNDAAGALPRLINMGIEPFLITSSINAVIAQRLVRKICPKCKSEQKLPEAVVEDIKKTLAVGQPASHGPLKFYHGRGCGECHQGYKGRIGIFEVLVMSDKIEELAVARAPASDILKKAIEEGMITMKQDGILKAIKGLTTIDEVLRATSAD